MPAAFQSGWPKVQTPADAQADAELIKHLKVMADIARGRPPGDRDARKIADLFTDTIRLLRHPRPWPMVLIRLVQSRLITVQEIMTATLAVGRPNQAAL